MNKPMRYLPVTDIEIGDIVSYDGEHFVVTDVQEIEDPDWVEDKPIGAETLTQITLDAEGAFRFSHSESLWVEKR